MSYFEIDNLPIILYEALLFQLLFMPRVSSMRIVIFDNKCIFHGGKSDDILVCIFAIKSHIRGTLWAFFF